jgi:DNA-binding CsgD family transcriptional regulator
MGLGACRHGDSFDVAPATHISERPRYDGPGLPMHSLRQRVAHESDVGEILEVLGRPGDGYGPSSLVGLEPLIARLLSERALRGPVIENRPADSKAGRATVLCVALTGFVELEQARAWVAAPPPQLVDHILEREQRGEETLLRPERAAELNAGGGLALVFMAFRLAASREEANLVIATVFDGFRLFHAGYRCPLLLHPGGSTARGEESLRGLGFRPVGDGRVVWLLEVSDLDKAPFNPFIVLGHASNARLGFSLGEKELLLHAVLGSSDVEIAQSLSISTETVKKRWRSIFERVSKRPELRIFPQADVEEAKRGPEKRGALLKFLNAHLEELRP